MNSVQYPFQYCLKETEAQSLIPHLFTTSNFFNALAVPPKPPDINNMIISNPLKKTMTPSTRKSTANTGLYE